MNDITSKNISNLEEITELNKLIHERVRLGIMTALATMDSLTFKELKESLKLSDGNLSVHLKVLEKHKYIEVQKTFSRQKPQSKYILTNFGRKCFKEYINQIENLINDINL